MTFPEEKDFVSLTILDILLAKIGNNMNVQIIMFIKHMRIILNIWY